MDSEEWTEWRKLAGKEMVSIFITINLSTFNTTSTLQKIGAVIQCKYPKSRLHIFFMAMVLSYRVEGGLYPEKWDKQLERVGESTWAKKGLGYLELPEELDLGDNRWWVKREYNLNCSGTSGKILTHTKPWPSHLYRNSPSPDPHTSNPPTLPATRHYRRYLQPQANKPTRTHSNQPIPAATTMARHPEPQEIKWRKRPMLAVEI